jgi:hypothetical protein
MGKKIRVNSCIFQECTSLAVREKWGSMGKKIRVNSCIFQEYKSLAVREK